MAVQVFRNILCRYRRNPISCKRVLNLHLVEARVKYLCYYYCRPEHTATTVCKKREKFQKHIDN